MPLLKAKVKPVFNGLVYSSYHVYYGHQTTQNFQLPYTFCRVDLYIAVTLYIMVTLPFPEGDHCCTQVCLYLKFLPSVHGHSLEADI